MLTLKLIRHGQSRANVGEVDAVEQFDEMANPNNCDIVTIADKTTLKDPLWTTGRWGVTGMSRRPPEL